MNKDNNFGRLLVLLLITLVACFAFYSLPNSIRGIKIKKVDLLSDIRIRSVDHVLDSLLLQLAVEDSLPDDWGMAADTTLQPLQLDSVSLALRDSLYRVMYAVEGADSLGIHIEDYSLGRTGLKRFFETLKKREELGRPVRIAFMGDSFIEGDIVVADFREYMQQFFGGRGVGFVPIHSVAAQFRPTIRQKSEGWISHSLMKNKEMMYTLPGMVFETEGAEAFLSCGTVNRYSCLSQVNTLNFIYEQNENSRLHLVYNNSPDTTVVKLPACNKITQYHVRDSVIREASIRLTDAHNFRALGVALEDDMGIVVDNFSLRGNSGLLLTHFDPEYCAAFTAVRPYDLIILQYGLNMVSEEVLQYGWYRQGMIEVIRHMRDCFPDSDLLLVGISDRGRVSETGDFETMPAVLAMLHAQRQTAKLAGVPFWNLFGAMGGYNSMVRFVENNWASKDYTHLSFRGGREIARALFEAILLEKQFYDEADKTI